MLQQAVDTSTFNDGPGLSLSDLFRMLGKHIRFILVMALACSLCALVYVTLKRPVYESSATLRIDSSRAGSLGVSDPAAPNVQDDSEIIKTEMGVMKSENVALGVLTTLSSDEFEKATGFLKSASTVPSSSASPAARSLGQERALQSFESKVTVKQVEGTQFITVGVSNSDPLIAADLANRLVASFQIQSIASRDASVRQLRSYLTAQIETMRAQVNVDQKKLADFQEANSILGTQGQSNTVGDRLKSLNDHLASADADRIEKEGQLRAAERGDAATLGSLYPNPKLNELQSQQGELYTKYAQLSAKFGAKYPPLVEIKRQLDMIDSEMSRNADAVRGRLRQEYQGAADVQKMFQRDYEEQMAAAYAVNRNQAEYARLLAEVTSGRELADSLQHKLDQAVVDAEVSGINVMPIDAAHPPTESAGPRKLVIILSGFLLGLIAGVAAAILFETLSDKVESGEQVESVIGYPLYGDVPQSMREPVMLLEPASGGAEAYRSIRNRLLSDLSGDNAKVIFVASAGGNDGSEAVAANTAISLAQAGHETLLVDADVHRPLLHQIFGVVNGEGLSEVLLGGVPTVMHPVGDIMSLSLMTAGAFTASSSDQLASGRFLEFLEEQKRKYQYILISGAPLLSSSDSMLLAKRVSEVLLVAQPETTQLRTLSKARSVLNQVGATVAGMVLREGSK